MWVYFHHKHIHVFALNTVSILYFKPVFLKVSDVVYWQNNIKLVC